MQYFEQELFAPVAIRQLQELSGLGQGAAEEGLRRHLGLCYDVCHAAVEFEDPAASIARLRGADIAVSKLQLSAALRIERATPAVAEHLRPFDEGVYLHQVVEQRPEGLVRYLDLPDAFAALGEGGGPGHEWRVHFHVPVFLGELEHFGTTQTFLREILALHRRHPISAHLEVETYTWDVLPQAYRREDVSQAIIRELGWARDQLAA